VFAGNFHGVFRSTDNGDNWSQINQGITNTTVNSLAINDKGHIFAGAEYGVFRSTDNGGNWTEINNGITNTSVRSLAINDSGHIFAVTIDDGGFRSTDNGNNWTEINNGLPWSLVKDLAINDSGHVFVGFQVFGGIYRSTDNGDNWRHILTDKSAYTLAINDSGHVFAVTFASVFRSTDNGENWTEINNGLSYTTTIISLAINDSGHIFVGSSHGVFRSTDNGDHWTGANNGLSSSGGVAHLLAINDSGHIFAAFWYGVFYSTDNGDNWTALDSGLPNNTRVYSFAFNNAGQVFAGTRGGGVFRSVEATTVSVESSIEIAPKNFELSQNYPNPFNPSTIISYSISKSDFVTLTIYDILGREIQTLVSKFQLENIYSVNFEASKLSSGIYFYRLHVGHEFVGTKKMLLMR